jgi:NlpC/P60 family putative phage cell wall peptidase
MTSELNRFVASARGWLGTPYLHQASVRGAGTDCLGLLRGLWRECIGDEPEFVPAYSPDWSVSTGREDLAAAADRWLVRKGPDAEAAGDVLLFRMRPNAVAKHLGIAADIGEHPTFIHAYTGHGVIENTLSAPWRRKIVARYSFPEGAK